jgi:hypothetical protein
VRPLLAGLSPNLCDQARDIGLGQTEFIGALLSSRAARSYNSSVSVTLLVGDMLATPGPILRHVATLSV